MEAEAAGSSVTEDEEASGGSTVPCLMRVGRNSDWLRLVENTEVTIGRGVDVTHQLLSPTCPLMISRLHCTFRQNKDGQWTVTDKKSLNGVWVNGTRIAAEKAHQLKFGDSIQLGVPVNGAKVEYDYILVQRLIKDIQPCLTKGRVDGPMLAFASKKSKRKLSGEEVEPSTSMPKLYRQATTDKSFAKPCPMSLLKHKQKRCHNEPQTQEPQTQEPQTQEPQTPELQPPELQPPEPQTPEPSGMDQDVAQLSNGGQPDLDNLQMYSQNILLLREQVDNTERQVASLEGRPQQGDPLLEEQVGELRGQLEMLRAEMQRMETLEKSFSETKRQLEAEKTQQQEELLKKQLEDALHEQKKVIGELALSRQGFEEMLLAKNKELEVTKEEKEKAKAQKEEVVTQVTEVLENELQCVICSELFIEAVILNCAHSFCCFCIKQWRKKKNDCPICRQAIKSQTRCLALDNCINGMVENLSLDTKARRQTLITERKAADSSAVVTVIHDDEDEEEEENSSELSDSSEVSAISDNEASSLSSATDSSMVSIHSNLSSAVSLDTDSSVHLEDSSSHSADESDTGLED